MDATSAHQDSLPVSSDALLARLDEWGLACRLFTHVPLRTVADAKAVEASLAVPGKSAFPTKNLYLRDRKRRNHLVTLHQDRQVDLKALGAAIGAPNPSFGSPERLLEVLGIRPGAVSPLAMITGVRTGVTFHLDAAARSAGVIWMHPLVNDRTVAMPPGDLLAFLDRIGCPVNWLEPGAV